MADKKKEEPAFRYVIPDSWRKGWWAMSAIALIVCCWYWFDGPQWWAAKFPPKSTVVSSGSGVETPLPAESPKPTTPCPPAKERKEIRVQVDPVEWSGWIRIPVGYKWRVSRPGTWEEYWFWDGRRIRVEDDGPRWLGDIENCIFKIRGTKGEVVVFLEKE